MISQREHLHTIQRIKVGLLGLATVILLIAFASAIMRTATREAPVVAIGAAKPDVVANMIVSNMQGASVTPLAEVGVAATDGNTQETSAPLRR